MTDIEIVLGTRPEIIKLAPVIRACEAHGVDYHVIHTGQHYSEGLDSIFFEQLELPKPDINLQVGSGNHGEQTGKMIAGIEETVMETDPAVLIVQGDTNSTLAGAIVGSKLDVVLAHVEAGLRSFDDEMPEEVNRVLADRVSDYLFAPTDTSADHLRSDGLPADSICMTGNTVVDAVEQHEEISDKRSEILEDLRLTPGEYAVMTAHRAENVDDPDRFQSLLTGAGRAAAENDLNVVYPIHPRATDRLESFDLDVPDRIRLIEPLGYIDFLRLQSESAVLLTDSGGIQEEACSLRVPCVTLRDNTERPETVDVGANALAGVETDSIVERTNTMLNTDTAWENPYGDGTAAEQILDVLGPEL